MATGTGNLPNPSMSFSPFAILTAEEMNDLVENIESLATGTGIGDGSVGTTDLADTSVTASKIDFTTFADFSTAELNTNIKWVDGKTIYKKTISIGALPNNAQKDTAHGVTGITNIVDMFGIAWRSSDNTALHLPFSSKTTVGDSIELYLQGSNIVLNTASNRSTYVGYVTILYTK